MRYRHLDPYTGKFLSPEPLSAGPIQVATYAGSNPLTFAPDARSKGTFTAVAEAAGHYSRGAELANVTGPPNTAVAMNFTNTFFPKVAPPATPQQITTIFDMALFGTGLGHGMGRLVVIQVS